MSERKVPKLRFAGFTDDWKQRKLGEIALFSKGKGYSKSDIVDAGCPIILYGQLYTNYQTATSEINTFVSNDNDAIKSLGNEVIVPASGETAEEIARASFIEKQGVIIGGDLNIIRPSEIILPRFLALSISTGRAKAELVKKAQGKSVVHLRNDDLKELILLVPSLPEQQAIGEFFRRLDDTIAFHQREWEKYKNLKISYLEKMFPQKNEGKPQLRFPNFTDAWKQRKLEEVLKIKSGMSQKDIEVENGKYPILATSGEIGRTNTALYDKESVLIGRKGTIDKPYYMNTPFWTVDTLFYSELFPKNSGLFIYALFQTIDWRMYDTSTGVPSLTSSTIHSIEVKIPPTEDEQQAIGEFFRRLDDTIAFHQRELEKHKKLKEGYLKEMFV